MPFIVEVLVFGIIIVWLIGITLLLLKIKSHYDTITQGANKKNLTTILEEVFVDGKSSKKDIETIRKRCDTIEKESVLHIQKIGLLRFNPFKDTGGDQSFILALVDGTNTGVVISSLYARSGTRWYAKRIKEGAGVDHDLSEEEKTAIKEAKKL